ncbi:YopX family protein [Brochothrix thermosphacta]|uniref:YopX family protein n=1 Tax=Brochothrix thermosphacta TaxID=2756 RepID=UPI0039B07EB8
MKTKFRAWDIRKNVMREVVVLHFNEASNISGASYWSEDMELKSLHGNHIELMQYTGLKDSNCVDIYEGDVVEFCDFDSLRTGGNTSDKTRKAEVVFIQGGYFVKDGDYEALLYDALINDSDLKIIGNVWEEGDVLNDRENSEGN